MKRTALIVGAAIGGLSAAIALRQAGWTVRLFERAATARELGFGLVVAPNAIAGLRQLGGLAFARPCHPPPGRSPPSEPVPISWTGGRPNHAALRVSSSRAWAGVR